MSKKKLFIDESDEDVSLKTENEYAKKYDKWREKEERHKLEQKYGDKVLNSDASISSDSEDDDEPLEINEETEKQFLKTLALLKTKDPRIYDPNYKFFDGEKEREQEKETKPKTLTFADSDESDNDGEIFTIEKKAPIIETDKSTIHDENNDTNMKKSVKKDNKEEKLKDYLTGKVEYIDNEIEQDLAPLKALWSDPKLNEGEVFLRDYILNKRYLEEGDTGEAVDKIRDDDDLEADEEMVEEQGKFERAYNFRFEEPDDEYLKRFPRTMNYIRPKDDRRSRKRAEVRTRKEEEKRKKMEEIARLKALKLKEIQEKIAKIKEVTGNEELAFKDEDIEGDFDPAEHDRRMQAIFDEQYYGQVDTEKPVFPDLDEELEIENWEKYQPENHGDDNQNEDGYDGPHCEDEDFNMDADYDPKRVRTNLLDEIKETLGKKRRNRKKKSKLAALLAKEKPKFVPTVAEKTYSEYMEEYYKMDCEDVIGGDLPTRFKYREVVPNDYGLTVEEILLADDKELTQWVPLKKIVRYRPGNVEKGEVNTYKQKAADVNLKKKVLPSLFKDLSEDPEIVVPIEKVSKKKKKKKNKNSENTKISESQEEILENAVENDSTLVEDSHSKKKKKSKVIKDNNGDIQETYFNVEFTNEDDNKKDNKEAIESKETKISSDRKKKKNRHRVPDSESNAEVIKSDYKNLDKNSHCTEIVPNGTEDTIEVKRRNKMKHTPNSFVVEDLVKGENESEHKLKKIAKDGIQAKDSIKRKHEDVDSTQVPNKRKKKNKTNNKGSEPISNMTGNSKDSKSKFKQKDKFKNKTESDNPLSKLSDERLKAYGLKPKKFRSFLKYKKF